MAAIDDLLRQIQDSRLKNRLETEITKLKGEKKFGLVFEDHIPECTPLYDIPVRRGGTVARKTGKISGIYKVLKISGGANSGLADCLNMESSQMVQLPVEELVSVACFGEPIFPSLEPIAKVENAPKDGPWNTIIEADNFHALQLLAYLYPKQIDCIYIDPPYNTGARDWKYNNDYVDASDAWRHSKWLSMMQKRLKLAKKILKPQNSVLVVTIDEKEYTRLGLLLEEIFPEANIQMVSTVINPAGVTRTGGFSRTDEYIFFVMFGVAKPSALPLADEWRGKIKGGYKDRLRWNGLQRSGTGVLRKDRPNMFYPVFINNSGTKIVDVGQPISLNTNRNTIKSSPGCITVWPLFPDGREGRWCVGRETLLSLIGRHYVKIGRFRKEQTSLTYLKKGEQAKVESGDFPIIGYSQDGSIIVEEEGYEAKFIPGSQWWISSHDATQNGTKVLSAILPNTSFSFPKSPYAIKDALHFFTATNPNAIIVDFFAGSGTTLHAVNLLNAEDGGNRQCILVTNNEVSEQDAKTLLQQSTKPGDAEWEKHGICRSVTWPRTEYSIKGKRSDGSVLEGEYYTNQTAEHDEPRFFFQIGFIEDGAALSIADKKQIVSLIRSKEGKGLLPQTLVKPDSSFIVSDKHTASILFDCSASDKWLEALEEQDHITEFYILTKDSTAFYSLKEKVSDLLGTVIVTENIKRPMKDGFAANVEYFKLGFLDRENVSLGRQFREILPLLWLKAGAIGNRPKVPKGQIPDMLILPLNRFAILNNEELSSQFIAKLKSEKEITTVYVVTNSESTYRHIASKVKAKKTYQLYRDYIDNFILGTRSDV
jgi:adenine-specific DNA-methyltransferase